MSASIKLIPRNVAALRKGQSAGAAPMLVPGNPVSTRLESGVGNCYPGLECDLRNLERRFFPFLEVDITDQRILIVGVDLAAVEAAAARHVLTADAHDVYRAMAADLATGRSWAIDEIQGHFGPLGQQRLRLAELGLPQAGTNRQPPDAWTAVRMLIEQSDVVLAVRPSGGRVVRELAGKRARYLDDNGALASVFLPGELTQSLCSPWTHDFRDCGCFYWAANHPDIVLPPLPANAPAGPAWDAPVAWERADRSAAPPPAATADDSTPIELDHYDINREWQTLNFVIDGREQVTPVVPTQFVAIPLATFAELEKNLRYAAGVELAVVHEYLAAAFSFRDPARLRQPLQDNVTAARAELMRVAVSEMRHVRVVNDVLMLFGASSPFVPALQIASELPSAIPGQTRPLALRAADPSAITSFIAVEMPSTSVDGVYSRILATLETGLGNEAQRRAIRTVMAEGEDHFETFQFVQEWLSGHDPKEYLRGVPMTPAPKGNPQHVALQAAYRKLLDNLHQGYSQGVPAGGRSINAARNAMVLPNGIDAIADKVASQGFLITFDLILDDARFRPIGKP